LIAPAKRLLEKGEVSTPHLGSCTYQAFESNMDFETRFMVDRDVVGCNWIEILPGKYTRRESGGKGMNANTSIECVKIFKKCCFKFKYFLI